MVRRECEQPVLQSALPPLGCGRRRHVRRRTLGAPAAACRRRLGVACRLCWLGARLQQHPRILQLRIPQAQQALQLRLPAGGGDGRGGSAIDDRLSLSARLPFRCAPLVHRWPLRRPQTGGRGPTESRRAPEGRLQVQDQVEPPAGAPGGGRRGPAGPHAAQRSSRGWGTTGKGGILGGRQGAQHQEKRACPAQRRCQRAGSSSR